MDKERIKIHDFIKSIPIIKNHLTTIVINTLHYLEIGRLSFYPEYKTKPLTYLDEVTKDIFMSVKSTGHKSWNQFCLYKDNYSVLKQFDSLIIKGKNNG